MGSATDERDWHELHSNGLCIRNIFCKGVAPIAQKPTCLCCADIISAMHNPLRQRGCCPAVSRNDLELCLRHVPCARYMVEPFQCAPQRI